MRKSSLCILLVAALGVIGAVGVRADPSSPQPQATPSPGPPGDAHVTVMSGKGRLGVAAIEISAELRAALGAPRDRGVLIDAVRPDSPAARAGLRVGDIVTDVDGAQIRSAADVIDALSDRKTGDEVAVAVLRKGQRSELRARLDSDPGPAWQSKTFRGYRNFPDDMSRWFPFDDSSGDLRRAIQDLERRMSELERHMGQPTAPKTAQRI